MNNKIIIGLMSLFFYYIHADGPAHSLKLIHHDDLEVAGLENELKNVYVQSFSAVYKDLWTEQLESLVLSGFDTYIPRFKCSQDMLLIVTQLDTAISGWALFLVEPAKERAILELICVAPGYWRQGLGKKLIASIETYYPTIKSIAVVTRNINDISPKFYQSLGFKKTNFMLPEYDPEEMQGYELELPIAD